MFNCKTKEAKTKLEMVRKDNLNLLEKIKQEETKTDLEKVFKQIIIKQCDHIDKLCDSLIHTI